MFSHPNSGTISLLNRPIEPGQFRPEIGMLFQDPDDQLFFAYRQGRYCLWPGKYGLSRRSRFAARRGSSVCNWHSFFSRSARLIICREEEKQMVAIASLLAMQPQVVLYDEPTASLDMRTRRRLISFLQHSTETMLVSSHDLEFVLDVCDRGSPHRQRPNNCRWRSYDHHGQSAAYGSSRI